MIVFEDTHIVDIVWCNMKQYEIYIATKHK